MSKLARQRIQPYRSQKWLDAVRSIESCVRCGRWGVEAAHRDEGKGTGIKTSDALTAALCKDCHLELGNGNHMTRAERRAEMDRAIVLTVEKLAEAGRIHAV